MKDTLTAQQAHDILTALDEAIEQGPWEESNFLRVIGKNLRKIRDEYASQLQTDNPAQELKLAQKIALHSGQQEIFVSLYSSQGSKLAAWERILANLPRQTISRPIYADEKEASQSIRAKENKMNEAYVGIYVNQSDILPVSADRMPLDKLGNPLLSIKDRILELENISRFVHLGEVYNFTKGRLINTKP